MATISKTAGTVTRRAMPLIRPEDWNRVAEKIAAKKNKSYQGRESGGWRHPWHTIARWDPQAISWAIQVKAGYVNAAETTAPAMPAEIAPAATRERLGITGGGRRVSPWLSEGPWIRIPADLWREVGTGSIGTEPVPAFFTALGVEGSDQIVIDAETESVSLVAPPTVPPERRRLLRAVDLVLTVPKPTLTPALTEGPGGTTALTWSVASAIGDPFLTVRRVHVPQAPPPTLQEQLLTGRSEDPFTETLVATVYLLSRPGVPLGTLVGPDWQPHVDHALFWNRIYQAKVRMNLVPPTPLVSPIPLAGGAGQGIIQSILDDLNAQDATLAIALGQGSTLTTFGSV